MILKTHLIQAAAVFQVQVVQIPQIITLNSQKVKTNKSKEKETKKVKYTDIKKEKEFPCPYCEKSTHRSLVGCDGLQQIIKRGLSTIKSASPVCLNS